MSRATDTDPTRVDRLTPYERAKKNHVLDRWLYAGTPRQHPYPCMCRARRGNCTTWCPCWGRIDHLDQMPEYCCGRRLAETSAAGPTAGLTDPSDTNDAQEAA